MIWSDVVEDELERDLIPYLPTLDEIRRACIEIQATWSDEERRRRRLFHFGLPDDEPKGAGSLLTSAPPPA